MKTADLDILVSNGMRYKSPSAKNEAHNKLLGLWSIIININAITLHHDDHAFIVSFN